MNDSTRGACARCNSYRRLHLGPRYPPLTASPVDRSTAARVNATHGVISGHRGPFRRAFFAQSSLQSSLCPVVHLRRSTRMPVTLPRPPFHPHLRQRQQQQQVYPAERRPRALPRSTTVDTRLPVPGPAPRGLMQSPSESATAEPTRPLAHGP